MSQETGPSGERSGRKELPIERGFPIERVNEIAEKESRAGRYYRPIYTMHKWWARRLGCVFRSISLYSLLDDPKNVEVHEPGKNGSLGDFGGGHSEVKSLIEDVDMADPESLWELYPKDVRIGDKKILDPFMGGGTSLVETSRFGVESNGFDLNPVAWLVTKKELDAGQVDLEKLADIFEEVKAEVAGEILQYYKTECPNGSHEADVMHLFWTRELDCVSCGGTVSLFKDYRIGKGRYENDDKYNVFCPNCESVVHVDDWRSENLCSNCNYSFTPEDGTAYRGSYTCTDCGQKYRITDAVQEQDGYQLRPYAVEYYCRECDEKGYDRSQVKGYKSVNEFDLNLIRKAEEEWKNRTELKDYIPSEKIPEGAITSTVSGSSSAVTGNNVYQHGLQNWSDMYNTRQLLCLSKLLRSIDHIDDSDIKEFFLLAFTGSLRFNSMMVGYQAGRNHITNIFKSNSFEAPQTPAEANLWGTEYGMGTFTSIFDNIIDAVEYAKAPTERYVDGGETKETPPFGQPIGENSNVYQGDLRTIDDEDEYDAVITDPPYYDNVIYSELSDYFYVWQKIILEDEYECFKEEKTPREGSIVTNPYLEKTAKDFEHELGEAFSVIHRALKKDGVLAFTYHHSDSESWGELLEALCNVGFEITATYPVSADTSKFIKGEAVEFDIIIVARPSIEKEPISWNSLRRHIYRTAQETRKRLEENREISQGDIGVIEMGECFHEYSKHHGEVVRAGNEMTAKEVVEEIYGIIQEGSDIGEIDVFLDLLETPNATYNGLNKLTRGTDASPEQMEDMRLYRMEGGDFILGTWDDEKRMAYIQERVNGDDEALNSLDKAQFLRYRYEQGKSTQNYLSKWDIDDELRDLCEGLADATGDDTYRRILGADSTLGDF